MTEDYLIQEFHEAGIYLPGELAQINYCRIDCGFQPRQRGAFVSVIGAFGGMLPGIGQVAGKIIKGIGSIAGGGIGHIFR